MTRIQIERAVWPDALILDMALGILERCKIPGEPGRIDEEIASLRAVSPDLDHAAHIVGARRANA